MLHHILECLFTFVLTLAFIFVFSPLYSMRNMEKYWENTQWQVTRKRMVQSGQNLNAFEILYISLISTSFMKIQSI